MSWIESRLRTWAVLPLVLLTAVACSEDPSDPDPCDSANPPASCEEPPPEGYAFVYEPPAGAPAITSMVLRGTFNNWGNSPGIDIPFEPQDDGSWVAYVELDSATTYEYKFVINGAWIGDMCNDATWGHANAGGYVHLEADGCIGENQNAIIVLADVGVGFQHLANDPTHVSIAGDTLSIRFTARRDKVLSARVMSGTDTSQMYVQFTRGLNDVWRGALPQSTGSYLIEIVTADGPEERGPYSPPADPFRSVSWLNDAVGYQIFPERFWNGDPSNDSLTLSTDEYVPSEVSGTVPTLAASWDAPPNNQHCCHQYYGGDLAGILEKLPHLVDLGVDVIYLNPIWHSGSAHGYDQFDYMRLAPEYGDSTLLRQFVEQVHAAGMKIIWDFVPNHSGIGFEPFLHAVENGPSSPYYDWYNFHPNANGLQAGDGNDYDAWYGFGSLPQLDTRNDEVFDYLMQVAEHWTSYGFDGIRVDVPNEIRWRDARFFPALRDRTKAIDPEVYLVGEIWQRDPTWLQGDQFDALMNYSVARDVVGSFALATMSGAQAWNAMVEMFATYPEAATAMLFNLIASHDTNRLQTFMGSGASYTSTPTAIALQRQRLASALLYALPGMPVTYYGDECAMVGSNEGSIHVSRRTMDWTRCGTDPYAMVSHYTQLAGLKHSLAALGSSVIREHEPTTDILSFLRGEPGTGEVLAAFNRATAARTLTLPAGTWVDAVGGASYTGTVELPAHGWRYLVRQ